MVGEQGASLSRRAAPAHRHRPRAVHQPAHPDLRRGHQRARLRERGHRPAQHGRHLQGRTVIIIAHRLERRAPRPPHRRHGQGAHRRERAARGARGHGPGSLRHLWRCKAGVRPGRLMSMTSVDARTRCDRSARPPRAILEPPGSARHELAGPKRLADEAAFLPAALSLQETPAHPAPRRAAWAICALFVIALAWSCSGKSTSWPWPPGASWSASAPSSSSRWRQRGQAPPGEGWRPRARGPALVELDATAARPTVQWRKATCHAAGRALRSCTRCCRRCKTGGAPGFRRATDAEPAAAKRTRCCRPSGATSAPSGEAGAPSCSAAGRDRHRARASPS